MVEYEYGTEMASPVAEAYTSAGEVYEADGVGDLEGAVEGDYAMEGVTAYTRDVVDATGVAAILSEEEEEDLHRQKQRKYLMMGGCLCFVVALAIIIPLVTMGTSKSPDVVVLRTQAPSFAPSPAPSSAPTNEPISEALVQTIQFIRQYDSIAVLETEEWWNNRSSSPYKAARWLSNGGIEKNLKLLQRFALATFYFSTSVNQQWKECSPTYGGCPKEPWLTDADECDWGFVICEKETGKVIGLNFRKFMHPLVLYVVCYQNPYSFSLNHCRFFVLQAHRATKCAEPSLRNSPSCLSCRSFPSRTTSSLEATLMFRQVRRAFQVMTP